MNPYGYFGGSESPALLTAPSLEATTTEQNDTINPDESLTASIEAASSVQPATATIEMPAAPSQLPPEPEPVVLQAVVVATPTYPVGKIDYNKPIVVHNSYDEDDYRTDARVIAVLSNNPFPVVVASSDDGGDEIVNQFDLDGDDLNGELKVVNIDETYPRTVYVVLEKVAPFGKIELRPELFENEAAALADANGEMLAVIPITLQADTFAERYPVPEPAIEDDEDSDDEDGDVVEDSDADASSVETEQEEEGDDTDEALPEGAVWVNGVVRKPGDKVTTYRPGRGDRVCTIIKTRSDAFKSLYVQADSGVEEPYWARNKNVRTY